MGNKNSALDAKMKAKEWQWKLKLEVKHLDKEIKKIEAGEVRIRKEIQAAAGKGNVSTVQMLAKSIVRSRKAVARLEKTKAAMYAVELQLTTSIATMSTSSAVRISADVMAKMNAISKVAELGGSLDKMRDEMSKCAEADDRMEELFRDDEEESEAAMEVQKVLEEMALQAMGPLSSTSHPAVAAATLAPIEAAAPERVAVAAGAAAGAAAEAPKPAAPAPKPPAPAAAAPAPGIAEDPVEQATLAAKLGDKKSVNTQATAPAAPAAPPASGGYAAAGRPAAAAPAPASAPAAAPASAAAIEEDDLLRRLQALKQS